MLRPLPQMAVRAHVQACFVTMKPMQAMAARTPVSRLGFLSRSLLPLHVRDVKETMTVAHILVKKIPET
jgi:hypothetical protein